MKLVVNTNRIIASLIKDSISRKIINHINAELIAIRLSECEINRHRKEILRKAKINEEEYQVLLEKIKKKLVLLDENILLSKMDEAEIIMDKIDPDDTAFIAAALATKADIWSDDKHFEKQNKIKIWKTKDLIRFI